MRESRFFVFFATFFQCWIPRVADRNFVVIVVFLKMYISMIRKPPLFALWDFFLPFYLYFPIFTWLIGIHWKNSFFPHPPPIGLQWGFPQKDTKVNLMKMLKEVTNFFFYSNSSVSPLQLSLIIFFLFPWRSRGKVALKWPDPLIFGKKWPNISHLDS